MHVVMHKTAVVVILVGSRATAEQQAWAIHPSQSFDLVVVAVAVAVVIIRRHQYRHRHCHNHHRHAVLLPCPLPVARIASFSRGLPGLARRVAGLAEDHSAVAWIAKCRHE